MSHFNLPGGRTKRNELTQEIFIHLLKALKSFDSSGSLPAWIQRVARNFAIDHYRRRRRERSMVSEGDAFDDARTPHRRTRAGAATPIGPSPRRTGPTFSGRVSTSSRKSSRRQFFSRDLQDMSYEEMADMLKVPLGTVKSRINRGRVELTRRLQKKQAEWSTGSREAPRGGPK